MIESASAARSLLTESLMTYSDSTWDANNSLATREFPNAAYAASFSISYCSLDLLRALVVDSLYMFNYA